MILGWAAFVAWSLGIGTFPGKILHAPLISQMIARHNLTHVVSVGFSYYQGTAEQ